MNSNRLIFLRHAETQKDPTIHATLWNLSEQGKIESEKVAQLDAMNQVDVIYVSEEKKTALTVEPLAQKLGKRIQTMSAFNEVMRGEKFLTKEEFEEEKKKQLEDLSFHAFGGESGLDALARFKEGVSIASQENKNKTILICTHGTVLNIYFADLMNNKQELPKRWEKTAFCAYGIIQNGKIERDIVEKPSL